MSYLTYWRLSRSPFSLDRTKQEYFVSGSIADALTRVDFLVQHGRRLGLLFGPRGVGKTSFLQYFVGRISRNPKQVPGFVDLAGSHPELFAKQVRDSLWGGGDRCSDSIGFSGNPSLGRTIHEIDDLIVANNAIGRQPILFLDNADEASEEVFQTLSILLRRPGHWSALVTLDESLLVEIPRRILEESDLRVDLPAWDLGLTAEYIEATVAKYGKRDDVFTAQGITRIHELGEGIPKRMFQLADLSLLVGAQQGLESIDADLVDLVSEDFSFGLLPRGIANYEYADR